MEFPKAQSFLSTKQRIILLLLYTSNSQLYKENPVPVPGDLGWNLDPTTLQVSSFLPYSGLHLQELVWGTQAAGDGEKHGQGHRRVRASHIQAPKHKREGRGRRTLPTRRNHCISSRKHRIVTVAADPHYCLHFAHFLLLSFSVEGSPERKNSNISLRGAEYFNLKYLGLGLLRSAGGSNLSSAPPRSWSPVQPCSRKKNSNKFQQRACENSWFSAPLNTLYL